MIGFLDTFACQPTFVARVAKLWDAHRPIHFLTLTRTVSKQRPSPHLMSDFAPRICGRIRRMPHMFMWLYFGAT